MWDRKLLLLFSLLIVLLCGCDVHQFPEPKEIDSDYTPPNKVTLHLCYEPDFWLWEHLYDPKTGLLQEQYPDEAVDEEHPGTTLRYNAECSHGLMRILIRAFRPDNLDRCLREYTFVRDIADGYDYDVDLDLAPGEYVLAVWSDLYEQPEDNPYYDPSNFRRVLLRYQENYRANTDYRDGYRGRQNVTISEPSEKHTVTMRRPMAKFEFITTDLSEFLEGETVRRNLSARAQIEDYLIEVAYTGYLPCSYSVIEDRLENAATGVRFNAHVQIAGEREASIGFDYVFINDTKEGGVQIVVSVYDLTGEQVARSRLINVPLRRNHHTVLRGAFLTTNASGGVGLDPGFDGDHNVVIP